MKIINKILLGTALIGGTLIGTIYSLEKTECLIIGKENIAKYSQELKKLYPIIEGVPFGLGYNDGLLGGSTGFYLKTEKGNIFCYTYSAPCTRIRSLIKSEIEDGDNESIRIRGKSTKEGLELIMLEANNEKLVFNSYLLNQIEK